MKELKRACPPAICFSGWILMSIFIFKSEENFRYAVVSGVWAFVAFFCLLMLYYMRDTTKKTN